MIAQIFDEYKLFRSCSLWYCVPTHARMVRPITIDIGSITAALHVPRSFFS